MSSQQPKPPSVHVAFRKPRFADSEHAKRFGFGRLAPPEAAPPPPPVEGGHGYVIVLASPQPNEDRVKDICLVAIAFGLEVVSAHAVDQEADDGSAGNQAHVAPSPAPPPPQAATTPPTISATESGLPQAKAGAGGGVI